MGFRLIVETLKVNTTLISSEHDLLGFEGTDEIRSEINLLLERNKIFASGIVVYDSGQSNDAQPARAHALAPTQEPSRS